MKQTLRGRLLEVVAGFGTLEFALFTTFNFHPEFFERNVLPTLFGLDLEEGSRRARAQAVHKALVHTGVSVFYDPAVSDGAGDRFRYGAFPVYLGARRRFHPKLIVLGGTDRQGQTWIYLACLSANLTRAGWGANCEGLADAWLHARSEQPVAALRDFLQWLAGQSRPGDKALEKALAFWGRLRERRSRSTDPEVATLADAGDPRFYAAPVHDSLWDFLSQTYGRLRAVRAGSPYWGEGRRIAHSLAGVALELVAARGPHDFLRAGLGTDTLAQLGVDAGQVRTWCHDQARFFHLKIYEVESRGRTFAGLGSCNFTEAGQFWRDGRGRESGNVECMLFSEAGMPWPPTEALRPGAMPGHTDAEDAPAAWPLYVTVAYDWQRHAYKWWLQGDPGGHDVSLQLPDGAPAFDIHDQPEAGRPGPLQGRVFHFQWQGQRLQGLVAETGLPYADLCYGEQLSPRQILDAWCSGAPEEPPVSGPEDDPEEESGGASLGLAGTGAEAGGGEPPFDWFMFFRSLAERRQRILTAGESGDRPHELVDLLVARTDSLASMAAAAQAARMPAAGRWIVVQACLRELWPYRAIPEVGVQCRVLQAAARALRQRLDTDLQAALRARGLSADPQRLLRWYEQRLGE